MKSKRPEEEYERFAKAMIGRKTLPPELRITLQRIDKMVGHAKPGGHLRSSQVTAVVVALWLAGQGKPRMNSKTALAKLARIAECEQREKNV